LNLILKTSHGKSTVKFNAIIQQNGEMNAAFVEFPFSTEELFNKKGQVKIKAVLMIK
jgi:hypothetical protein